MGYIKVATIVVLFAVAVSGMPRPEGTPYLPPQTGYNYEPPENPLPTPARPPLPPVRPTPTEAPFDPNSSNNQNSIVKPNPPKPPVVKPQPPAPKPPAPKPPAPKPPAPKPPAPKPTPPPTEEHTHEHEHEHEHSDPYEFRYDVKDEESGADFWETAASDGLGVITGEYRVRMADGRLQVVRYTADWKTGFHPTITYE